MLITDVEIIAVDDGSQDGTLTILKRLAQLMIALKIISHDVNKGYGSALRSGILAARHEFVLLMDSDGQIRIDSLKMIWPLRNGYAIFLGYRGKRTDNIYRCVLGRLGNTMSNYFLRHRILDINCGFKLFKRDVISRLVLSSTGGLINFEILYYLFKNYPSLKIYQFPVEHYPRKSGKGTGGDLSVIYKIITEGAAVILKRDKR